MRLLHVVAGLPQAGGGLVEVVPRLARELVRIGHEATIATVARPEDVLAAAADLATAAGVSIVRFAPSAPRAAYCSRAMLRGLRPLADQADLVHVHSNWTFPVWWGCRAARCSGKPLVMSPHGCLDPVRRAHSAWKKRLVGPLDRRCLRGADVIHATGEAERAWIEGYLGGRPRVEVVPNGIDLPERHPVARPEGRTRRVLFLGRLHPLKGLDLLLDAWGIATRALGPAERWELVVAGPDEHGTRADLERQAARIGLTALRFSGPLYGNDKDRAIAEADLFVLPSRSENFGIVVAEALAAGVPVVATKGTPWKEIDGVCGWWVDAAAEPLAAAMLEAMRLTADERTAMGDRGRRLVEEQYTWTIVARQMERLYASLIGADRRHATGSGVARSNAPRPGR